LYSRAAHHSLECLLYERSISKRARTSSRCIRAAFGNKQAFPNPDGSNPIEGAKLPGFAAFALDRERVVGGFKNGTVTIGTSECFRATAGVYEGIFREPGWTRLVDEVVDNNQERTAAPILPLSGRS